MEIKFTIVVTLESKQDHFNIVLSFESKKSKHYFLAHFSSSVTIGNDGSCVFHSSQR